MSMSDPDLLHPTSVIVEIPPTRVLDTVTREVLPTADEASDVEIDAQVSWGRSYRETRFNGGSGGVTSDASGYLVFKISDQEDRGIELARNMAVRVPTGRGRERRIYLGSVVHIGHYEGAPTMEAWDVFDKPLDVEG